MYRWKLDSALKKKIFGGSSSTIFADVSTPCIFIILSVFFLFLFWIVC